MSDARGVVGTRFGPSGELEEFGARDQDYVPIGHGTDLVCVAELGTSRRSGEGIGDRSILVARPTVPTSVMEARGSGMVRIRRRS